MDQHYQVINLHNIIRNQQSKIQQLRQQLRIANEREGIRYGQFVENNKVVLAQKDKVIDYLKGELNKVQNNNSNGVNDINDKHQKQKEKYEKQIMGQKRKTIELEAKLKRQQNQYQAQIQNLKQSQLKYIEELKKMNETRSLLSAEIGKLNHYYKSSLFEIGKRKETLLWVEKFTQFLETTNKKEKRTLEDVSSFVKDQINGLKINLGQMVREVIKNEEDIRNGRESISDEVRKVGEEIKRDCEKALVQNEQFWNAIKSEKQNVYKQESKALNSSLNRQIEGLKSENQQLRVKVKSLEGEKKTIILGFQQLRNLNESRQSVYRQQIKNLKKAIEDLIEAGTRRDQQFEKEIKYLSSQIQNISSRYYENIEFPLRKTNMKISEDVAQVKVSLSNLQENNKLKLLIENVEKFFENQSEKRGSESLQSYLENENQAINILTQMLQSGDEGSFVIHNSGERNHSQSKTFTSRNNTFDKDYEDLIQQQQIVLKQKYNKSQYEVILAKKHLTKLKQYCENLEKKHNDLLVANEQLKNKQEVLGKSSEVLGKSSVNKNAKNTSKPGQNSQAKNNLNNTNILNDQIATKRDTSATDGLNKRIAQLQAENESLKQSFEALQGQFRTYYQSLKKKVQLKSSSEEIKENIYSEVKCLISKIYNNQQKIENYIQKEKVFRSELKQNVNQIKHLIFQPIKSLEILAKEVTQIGFGNALRNYSESQQLNTQRIEGQSLKSQLNQQSNNDVKAYKQILSKKAQNYQQTNKVILELIKTLREGSISIKEGKQKYDHKKQKQEELALTSRKQTGTAVVKALEKKIKQSQVQRLKDKQDLAERLRLIQTSIDKIGQKINKSISIKTMLNKFEFNLDSKINEIVSKTQIKLDKEEILVLKDEVIGDLKVKLHEANNECEGLRKEMSMLYYEKRS